MYHLDNPETAPEPPAADAPEPEAPPDVEPQPSSEAPVEDIPNPPNAPVAEKTDSPPPVDPNKCVCAAIRAKRAEEEKNKKGIVKNKQVNKFLRISKSIYITHLTY